MSAPAAARLSSARSTAFLLVRGLLGGGGEVRCRGGPVPRHLFGLGVEDGGQSLEGGCGERV